MVQARSLPFILIKYNKILLIAIILFIFLIINIYQYFSIYLDCSNYYQREQQPIDVVYTWVNGSDPKFIENVRFYSQHNNNKKFGVDHSFQRFDEKDELKYSLRALEKNAPWVNHVYIVTNGQIPNWLNLNYEKVTLVTHEDIFRWKFHLPTFSSPGIESNLHRIPGLTDRFIYLNDDLFFQKPIYPEDFWSINRGFLVYLAWPIPDCASQCSWKLVGNGICDRQCYVLNCDYDGGDCNRTREDGQALLINPNYGLKKETNYSKLLKLLHDENGKRNQSLVDLIRTSFRQNNSRDISELIQEHNKRKILVDKLVRRRKRRSATNLINNNNETNNEKNTKNSSLTDAYGQSLQYTNRILNKHYGYYVRRVPAHAPLLIDKKIVRELHREFSGEIFQTSRNRFRNYDDFQYGLSYYYHMMHKKIQLTVGEIFDKYDTDKSGIWSETEMRTVISKLYHLPLSEEERINFWDILKNCTGKNYPPLRLSRFTVINCSILIRILKETALVGKIPKYKYEIIQNIDNTIHFKMLTSNKSEVYSALDDIRREEKKFVCLNDNLDPNRPEDNRLVKQLMHEFYLALFPFRSQFELPSGKYNKYSTMREYRASQRTWLSNGKLILILSVMCFLYMFWRKIIMCIRRCYLWIALNLGIK